MNDAWGETADSLIMAAAERGHRISRAQLKRWHAAGLLPRPRRRSLGKGHGTVTLYPPGTTPQLLRLLDVRAERGRFDPDAALLRLWWEGYPVAPVAVHDGLRQVLDGWERLARPWASLDDVPPDEWAKLDRQLAANLLAPLLAVRQRVGRRTFRRVAATLLSVAAGGFEGFQSPQGAGMDDMAAVLGVEEAPWVSGDLETVLSQVSTVVRAATLRRVLNGAADAELEAARDEARTLVGLIDNVGHLAQQLGGGPSFEPFESLDARFLSGGMLAAMTLFWLTLRPLPAFSKRYRQLAAMAEMVATLRQVTDAIQAAGTTKPPRRLEPSGGMAQGESSPCTPSLSPPPASPRRETAS